MLKVIYIVICCILCVYVFVQIYFMTQNPISKIKPEKPKKKKVIDKWSYKQELKDFIAEHISNFGIPTVFSDTGNSIFFIFPIHKNLYIRFKYNLDNGINYNCWIGFLDETNLYFKVEKSVFIDFQDVHTNYPVLFKFFEPLIIDFYKKAGIEQKIDTMSKDIVNIRIRQEDNLNSKIILDKLCVNFEEYI